MEGNSVCSMCVCVSVIIPTYKNPTTLSRAIDSVLFQKDFFSFEIIVVDDNNPSSIERIETEKTMLKYLDNNKVIYVKHEKNKNGAAARNTGFKYSSGKYIAFLDDDDVFVDTKLKKQYEYMEEHPEFGASYTWRLQGKDEIIRYDKTGDLTKEILLLDFFPTTITIMMKRECYETLGGFDERFRRHQDFEFLLRFFELYKIGIVPEALSRIIGKRSVGNQLRGKDFENLKIQFLNTFNDVIEHLEMNNPGIKHKIYATHYAEIFVSEVSTHYYGLAFKTFFKCVFIYRQYFLSRIINHYSNAINRRRVKT